MTDSATIAPATGSDARTPYRGSMRPFYQEIVAADPVPPPLSFREAGDAAIPVSSVPRARYTCADFARREVDHMWSRVWQMACREEEIPEPGDCMVYDGPGISALIVRDDLGTIRAFYNSCPHRGMKLCASAGSVSRFTCPFHSIQWSLDGKLRKLPQAWDFDEIDASRLNLKPVRAETWGGFVFINRDADADPLEQYLGRMTRDFAEWDRTKVYLETQIRKTVNANWKVCIEGFLEAYHISGVHAQALPFGGDSSVAYDVWADQPHVSRFLQPLAFQSDQWPGTELAEQQIAQAAVDVTMGPGMPVTLRPGQTARGYLIEAIRAAAGEGHARHSDSEMVDAMQYSLFPNLILFRSYLYPLAYRFLPVPGNPDQTTFDMLIFRDRVAGEEPPLPNHVTLGPDESYAEAGALPAWLAQIYDQDANAFPGVQQGMHDGSGQDIVFAGYQEIRLRHLHATLSSYLDTAA